MTKISQRQLQQAVEADIITSAQAQNMIALWQDQIDESPTFSFSHILYYLGGLVAIAAVTLFFNLGWQYYKGLGLVTLCGVFSVVGWGVARFLMQRQFMLPAGISFTFVICLTPLAVFGIQHMLGLWPEKVVYSDYHRDVKWYWVYMELATLLVGALVLYIYRFPFMVMPIAVTLWYFSLDATVLFIEDSNWDIRKRTSMLVGFFMVVAALVIDYRSSREKDFAFWLYIVGGLTFWGGLSLMESDSEWSKFLYCMTNFVLVVIGAVIRRRIFVILGGLGVFGYLGHLAFDVFKDTWFFPISLTILGMGIVLVGIVWQKREAQFVQWLMLRCPAGIQTWLHKIQ
ncbi:DUF2157 domain-containing protein [Aestuariibacter sp. AA17]|uniref:DUF2157 domain-containing protein n=1 Tax=Fluctibacter corallii TaxID=2984329 RepID=A0ABT3A4T0_9ALTE|nr:DUF2157 domain-containing protein [Aestuariibacter sp. AA17]MCV2883679.1 DUF2157 domain-containing protein [Aestuariibacter sp. AA17]